VKSVLAEGPIKSSFHIHSEYRIRKTGPRSQHTFCSGSRVLFVCPTASFRLKFLQQTPQTVNIDTTLVPNCHSFILSVNLTPAFEIQTSTSASQQIRNRATHCTLLKEGYITPGPKRSHCASLCQHRSLRNGYTTTSLWLSFERDPTQILLTHRFPTGWEGSVTDRNIR